MSKQIHIKAQKSFHNNEGERRQKTARRLAGHDERKLSWPSVLARVPVEKSLEWGGWKGTSPGANGEVISTRLRGIFSRTEKTGKNISLELVFYSSFC